MLQHHSNAQSLANSTIALVSWQALDKTSRKALAPGRAGLPGKAPNNNPI
jgi:hypothetical protein